MFSVKRTATMTVARSKFFSTIEPPPTPLPPPPPTPKAPESPASFPECSRMRKIKTTAKITWMTLKSVNTERSLALLDFFRLAGARPVPVLTLDAIEDLQRLAAKLGVEDGEVLV